MLVFAALQAHAYAVRTTDDGTPVRWPAWPVAWDHGTDEVELPEGAGEALEASFATWQLADTEVEFLEQDPASDAVPKKAADGHNHVWSVTPWPLAYGTTIALASVWCDGDGNVVSFDIQVSGDVPWSVTGEPGAYDLQAAITHEVGHVLGLEHSDLPEAVMFPSTGMSATGKRDLDLDDIDGAHFLYADDGEEDALPTPSILTGSGCSTGPTRGGLAPLLLFTPFLRRRARLQEVACSRS